ncbi:aminotransferase class V-fold PLP-dependent enzyme [Novosphingobium sp. ERN07]|uniref:aminotransferase class V-fold PLP-dependent enzyme n=1 Tax=Novosphingobium sp. ERN07 TaxID=2726187 RepID=UPI001457919E|nr:aminotransferase class V-fold PLP-dependent enzyme [Novosphingobium sp. ERN07]NLR70300.1 aminotransferase class V-fold PLP-dependent enzyme [Novosphingobium sp. ERN07]
MTNRRQFLVGAGAASMGTLLAGRTLAAPAQGGLGGLFEAGLSFEQTQQRLSAFYEIDRSVVNFDAAYYGAMTKSVHAAYLDKVAWVNRYNSTFLRSGVPGMPRDQELDKSRTAVADLIGASLDEVALSGGGTEGLYALITNYALLKAGDAVIYCDVDYDEMQFAMDYLEQSRGARVVRFSLPEPHTRANILAAYEKVLKETPRARLLLLTHVSNRNGLIPPVKEIVAMAKARGVDVILDSAQAVGQMPFNVADTGADFIGFSLHKWLAAPLGTGGIFIRKSRLADIQPWLGNRIHSADDIRSRIPTGTVDFAARLTIPAALEAQATIGIERKFAHLKSLRNYWISRVRDVPGLQLMLPDEPGNYGAISAFRLPGVDSPAKAKSAQALFMEKYKLLVVAKAGLASGMVLRVTPALFNTSVELDRLVAAIHQERRTFV